MRTCVKFGCERTKLSRSTRQDRRNETRIREWNILQAVQKTDALLLSISIASSLLFVLYPQAHGQMIRFTGDSWGPTVNVLTWLLWTASVLAVIGRLVTKNWIVKKLTMDDYLLLVALVCGNARRVVEIRRFSQVYANRPQLFSSGQTLAVSLQTEHGYGEHIATLEKTQLENIMVVRP